MPLHVSSTCSSSGGQNCIIQYYTVQQTVQQTYTVLSFLSFLQVFNDSSFSLGIQIIWDPHYLGSSVSSEHEVCRVFNHCSFSDENWQPQRPVHRISGSVGGRKRNTHVTDQTLLSCLCVRKSYFVQFYFVVVVSGFYLKCVP